MITQEKFNKIVDKMVSYKERGLKVVGSFYMYSENNPPTEEMICIDEITEKVHNALNQGLSEDYVRSLFPQMVEKQRMKKESILSILGLNLYQILELEKKREAINKEIETRRMVSDRFKRQNPSATYTFEDIESAVRNVNNK